MCSDTFVMFARDNVGPEVGLHLVLNKYLEWVDILNQQTWRLWVIATCVIATVNPLIRPKSIPNTGHGSLAK